MKVLGLVWGKRHTPLDPPSAKLPRAESLILTQYDIPRIPYHVVRGSVARGFVWLS